MPPEQTGTLPEAQTAKWRRHIPARTKKAEERPIGKFSAAAVHILRSVWMAWNQRLSAINCNWLQLPKKGWIRVYATAKIEMQQPLHGTCC